ncbi:MAG: hypothetical protein RLZZ309_457 [Bacteroidota bacterium]|jgi:hypothetical protein
MERVAALVEKLTTQLAEKADKSQLKQTAVQLLAALSETDQFNNLPNNVSVMIPGGEAVTEVIDRPIPETQPVEVRIPSLPKLEPVEPLVPIVPIVNESISKEINATIKHTELQEKLALEPIKDLKAGIGTNDKFQFIAALFGGDEKAFDQAIKTINGFKIYAEAQFWIKSNLREQNRWDETDEVVKAFDLLVKRRFA